MRTGRDLPPEAQRLAAAQPAAAGMLSARFLLGRAEACAVVLGCMRRAAESAGASATAADWERLAGLVLRGDPGGYDAALAELVADSTRGYRRYPGGAADLRGADALALRDDGPLRHAEAEARRRRPAVAGDPYLCLLYAEAAAKAVGRRRELLARLRCREM